jgi:hypothetical protein
MELGPDLVALLAQLREMEPNDLEVLLRNPAGATRAAPTFPPPLPMVAAPLVPPPGLPSPPRTVLEKFGSPEADLLRPHYGTYLPPFERVFPGSDAARFADVISFSADERPILLVGVMRNNTPELIPLWGAAQHLDPPYARTSAHASRVAFCRDVVQGNLPASTLFSCDWLVTETLELLDEGIFEERLEASPAGAATIPESDEDEREDLYVPQAAVIPSCLVPDLLRLPRDPVAAWRLLRLRARELGLLEQCTSLWRLLRSLASTSHREESCVTLELVDGNAHFVGSRRATLEAILPALAPGPPVANPLGCGRRRNSDGHPSRRH